MELVNFGPYFKNPNPAYRATYNLDKIDQTTGELFQAKGYNKTLPLIYDNEGDMISSVDVISCEKDGFANPTVPWFTIIRDPDDNTP